MAYIPKVFTQLLGLGAHFFTETVVIRFSVVTITERSPKNLIHLTMNVLVMWVTNY